MFIFCLLLIFVIVTGLRVWSRINDVRKYEREQEEARKEYK